MAKAQIPLAKNLKSAEEYFIAEANALRAVHGTPWIFVGVAVMIDYLATLEKGSRADRSDYISVIRRKFPPEYREFKYAVAHRKAGTGQAIKVRGRVVGHKKKSMTRMDLPEQMYFIFRCGLVHAFSLVPSATERGNGGRTRSVTLNSRADSSRDGIDHLQNYKRLPLIEDSAYFVDEDLLDGLIVAIKSVFADKSKHRNIRAMLNKQPPVWPI